MIDEFLKKWLIKAIEDFNASKYIVNLSDEKILTSIVCFHCQQTVEKLFKAYLITKKIDFAKTHDLELLIKLCVDLDNEFKNISIDHLSDYAVEIRYPDEFYIPSIEEAKKCFEIASNVKDFIFKKLEIKEEDLVKNEKRGS
ncbi:MAG: hypothetical protein DDT42_01099 [candidate division WS2 bacterium]|uniref:HEPN domain-containing protein n=1 Tax=Psychracetigena formicireducens TaxID=2986056 RepID=A0A9E2F197_PSYF1|nr:hypothetical protein [Candidatus Psychracetigena formicireducens]MBT9145229.1 hypothetical protein [Candidatus Psychracetigena formicireducens]